MNEFYVGYLPKAPAGIGRKIRAVVAFLLLIGAACAIAFAMVQRTFAPSAFEYGKDNAFEGVLEETPYPTLVVKRPGESAGETAYSRYLLVAGGKHGANAQTAGYGGKTVRLRGALIYRDNQTMIELVSGSISVLENTGQPREAVAKLGEFVLAGEIVDTKCYLGVMNPGNGKVHRDCAVRCLSGGIPPALVTRDLNGTPAILLLTDTQNNPLPREVFLRRVGQPVRIRGKVLRSGDTLFLKTEPKEISPLP
jgi:hypothetical protein